MKPDAPMIAFLALALGTYVECVYRGLTPWRAARLGTWTAWAVSSKEITGPLFVLPWSGLLAVQWYRAEERAAFWRSAAAAVAALLIWYVGLNIWYAPATWAERMRFWLGGPGVSSAIWGHPGQTHVAYAWDIVRGIVENVGPGGAIVVLVAIGASLAAPSLRVCLMALPVASFVLVGLAPLGYVPDYFCTPAALALTPLVAWALDRMTRHAAGHGRVALVSLLVVCGLCNALYANRAWLDLQWNVYDLAERDAMVRVGRGGHVGIFWPWPRTAGKSRLDVLGIRLDARSGLQLAADRRDLPDLLYVDPALVHWLAEVPQAPERAQMIEIETGFDVRTLPSFEGLGYRLEAVVNPSYPPWFQFGWLPRAQGNNRLGVFVYRLRRDGAGR
jgi:hypothetical protein